MVHKWSVFLKSVICFWQRLQMETVQLTAYMQKNAHTDQLLEVGWETSSTIWCNRVAAPFHDGCFQRISCIIGVVALPHFLPLLHHAPKKFVTSSSSSPTSSSLEKLDNRLHLGNDGCQFFVYRCYPLSGISCCALLQPQNQQPNQVMLVYPQEASGWCYIQIIQLTTRHIVVSLYKE